MDYAVYVTEAPVPLAARSKTHLCGRLAAGIAGSNPARCIDPFLLWVLCIVTQRSLLRADHSSIEVLPAVVRRCV